MMPAEFFDTPTHRKILRVLAEKNRQYTTAELAEMTHRSKSTVSRTLSDANRYPFLTVDRVENSKAKLYGLDSAGEYTGPIRRFFRTERDRERRNGTIPVDVWNLLEDVTVAFADGLDEFLELFLFGSYATGEYYAGSDLDLVLVVDGNETPARVRANDVLDNLDPSHEIQLLVIADAFDDDGKPPADRVREIAREGSPVSNGEPLIPLWGDSR